LVAVSNLGLRKKMVGINVVEPTTSLILRSRKGNLPVSLAKSLPAFEESLVTRGTFPLVGSPWSLF